MTRAKSAVLVAGAVALLLLAFISPVLTTQPTGPGADITEAFLAVQESANAGVSQTYVDAWVAQLNQALQVEAAGNSSGSTAYTVSSIVTNATAMFNQAATLKEETTVAAYALAVVTSVVLAYAGMLAVESREARARRRMDAVIKVKKQGVANGES